MSRMVARTKNTGKVSDAMCGAKHSEENIAPADCVRACVQKGANYALVGDAVYTLALTRRIKPRRLNLTSSLGNKPKLQAQPTDTLFR